MRTTLFAMAFTAAFAQHAGAAPSATAEDIFGRWRVPSNGSVIEIYKCGARVCCKVVSVKDPRRRDVHNPNPALRKRRLVGVVLMNNGKRSGPRSYTGEVYSTLDGQTYRGTLNVISKKQMTMVGCTAFIPICEAITFTRVKPAGPKSAVSKPAVFRPAAPKPAAVKQVKRIKKKRLRRLRRERFEEID